MVEVGGILVGETRKEGWVGVVNYWMSRLWWWVLRRGWRQEKDWPDRVGRLGWVVSTYGGWVGSEQMWRLGRVVSRCGGWGG